MAALILAALCGGSADAAPPVPAAPAGPARPLTGEQAGAILRRLAADLEPLATSSRKVLLGGRKLNGESCVRPAKSEDLKSDRKPMPAYVGGGVGTSLLAAHTLDVPKCGSAVRHYQWRQTVLRNLVTQMRERNKAVLARAELLSLAARDLADGAAAWAKWPAGLTPAVVAKADHQPGACLASLNRAVGAEDLVGTARWSRELASALFALADLHRWVDFLLANRIDSLNFEAACAELPDWAEAANRAAGTKYDPWHNLDMFPAAAMVLPNMDNLYEVERQAERLFRPPAALELAAAPKALAVPAAVWMPPELRESFVLLRSALSPVNQAVWDRAASMPFERSYLANILYRMSAAKALDALTEVLGRFDKAHPRAEVADLMGVLFYRGDVCGGHIWGDRFDTRLMRAAGRLAGDDESVLRRAHDLTNTVLGNWANYEGGFRTLRDALDEQKMDCIRGTDMIAALYRNAGRSGFRAVHLSAGTAAHSMAAVDLRAAGVRATLLADSLDERGVGDVWPSAFFHGHQWPEGYPGPRGCAFTVELLARGLDNYVFLDGYIIRGRRAGELHRAAVPYLPGRQKADAEKVFGGPYPAILDGSATPAASRGG